MAIDLLILVKTCLMCDFHVNLWSITTPRNVVSLAWSISCAFNLIFRFSRFLLFVKSMQLVLERFNFNLLLLNHSTTLLASLSMTSFSNSRSGELNIIVVSSANCRKFSSNEQYFISFMKIKNKRGPRVDPCGTPMFTIQYRELSV